MTLFFTTCDFAYGQNLSIQEIVRQHLSDQIHSFVSYLEDGWIFPALQSINYQEEIYSTGIIPVIIYNNRLYQNVPFSPSQADLQYIRQTKAELTNSLVSSFDLENLENAESRKVRVSFGKFVLAKTILIMLRQTSVSPDSGQKNSQDNKMTPGTTRSLRFAHS